MEPALYLCATQPVYLEKLIYAFENLIYTPDKGIMNH
jgi:hypothetical protein